MIDEHRQDLAAEYALDALDPESARAFEAMLANDAELKALTVDLRETAAALAHAAPAKLPPPELRERILSRIRAEAQGGTQPAQTPMPVAPTRSQGGGNLLPWALAAGFAITTGALWMDRSALRQEALALKSDVHELRTQDALKKIQIATLSTKVDAYAKATAVVIWDEKNQRGVLKLANIPLPESGKDYQLWVVDPKYPDPVNGGIIPVNKDGIAQVSFAPDQPIKKADKFAISVEPAGGVRKATGQIVFLGD